MSTSDHAEGLRRAEVGSSISHSDGLLSSVDEIWVHLFLCWESIEAEYTILTLKSDVDTWLEEVSANRGNTDSKVDEHAILELLGCSANDAFTTNKSITLAWNLNGLSWDVLSGELDALLVVLTLEDALYIACGEMDIIWLKGTNWYNLLNFDDASLSSNCDIWVEVSG